MNAVRYVRNRFRPSGVVEAPEELEEEIIIPPMLVPKSYEYSYNGIGAILDRYEESNKPFWLLNLHQVERNGLSLKLRFTSEPTLEKCESLIRHFTTLIEEFKA